MIFTDQTIDNMKMLSLQLYYLWFEETEREIPEIVPKIVNEIVLCQKIFDTEESTSTIRSDYSKSKEDPRKRGMTVISSIYLQMVTLMICQSKRIASNVHIDGRLFYHK